MDDQLLLQFTQQVLGQRFQHLQRTLKLDAQAGLSDDQRQQLRRLFTDYEWMLAKKLARQTDDAVILAQQYNEAKFIIARVWLQQPEITTRFVRVEQPDGVAIHLQLRLQYTAQLMDVLDFVVPAGTATQLETHKLDLLTWANQH